MKTSVIQIIIMIAPLFATNDGQGQSTFLLQNFLGHDSLDAPVFDASGTRLAGANYVCLLYGGQTPGSLAPGGNLVGQITPVPFTYVAGGLGGYFSGGTVQVDTFPCGYFAWLQVRAWDTRLGATYEDVVKLGLGGYGESNVFQERGGNPCGPISPPGLLLDLQSFSLLPEVPEPSSLLLLLLGLPAIFLIRRRSK